ncbi:hypothetical protein CR513_42797, partial [Mucuna pruriens]
MANIEKSEVNSSSSVEYESMFDENLLKNKTHPYDKFGIRYDKKNDKSPIKRCYVCNSTEHVKQACIPMKRFKIIVKKSNLKGSKKIWYQNLNFFLLHISLVGKGMTSH